MAAWALTLGEVLACGAWVFAGSAWRVDLLANLTAQVGALWLLTVVVWALLRWWRRLVVLLLAAPLLGLALIPGRAGSGPASDAEPVRLLTYNAYNEDTSGPASALALEQLDVDVMTIIEPTVAVVRLFNESEEFRERYPYLSPQHPYPSRPTVVSRWPLIPLKLRYGKTEEGEPDPGMSPTGVIVDRPGGAFVLIAVHPPSPRSAGAWVSGNEGIRRLSAMINELRAEHGLPVVVGGDFNSTPTGWRSRALRARAGLKRGKPWLSAHGTWPSGTRWPARLAIDDVFVSEGVGVATWEPLAPAAGGDHSPVRIDLRIPRVERRNSDD